MRARGAKTVVGARMAGARTVEARMVGSGVEGATPAVVAMTMRAAIARTLTRLAGVMTVPAQSVPQIQFGFCSATDPRSRSSEDAYFFELRLHFGKFGHASVLRPSKHPRHSLRG